MQKTITSQKGKIKEKTNTQKILYRFFSRKVAVAGVVILGSIFLLALFGSLLWPVDSAKIDGRAKFQGPSAAHLFGTDDMGRDTLARIIDGARITLIITGGSVCIAMLLGTALGLIAGYRRGKIDTVISGVMDSLWALPSIILAMTINAVLGPSLGNIVVAIGIVNIPDFYRIVRSRVITIREMEYITGARAIGLNDFKIIWRYILPNLLSTLIVQMTITAAKAALAEAALSFLGLGVPPPRASWGTMLKSGYAVMTRSIWISIFPGFFIMLLVLSLNLVGDGLRDALDVRIRAD